MSRFLRVGTSSDDESWRFPACFLLGAPLELSSPNESCRRLMQIDLFNNAPSLAVRIVPYAPQGPAPTTVVVGRVAALRSCFLRLPLPQGVLFFRAGELELWRAPLLPLPSRRRPHRRNRVALSSSRRIPHSRRRRRRPSSATGDRHVVTFPVLIANGRERRPHNHTTVVSPQARHVVDPRRPPRLTSPGLPPGPLCSSANDYLSS